MSAPFTLCVPAAVADELREYGRLWQLRARVGSYLARYPEAAANDVQRAVPGRRADVLAAVLSARSAAPMPSPPLGPRGTGDRYLTPPTPAAGGGAATT